jgi:hypothetical protein
MDTRGQIRALHANYDEGINPFSVVMIDNGNKTTEFAYQTALKAARNYDDLGNGVRIPLQELHTLQSTRAVIPNTFVSAKAMLKGFYIVVVALLGDQHALTPKYKSFLDD